MSDEQRPNDEPPAAHDDPVEFAVGPDGQQVAFRPLEVVTLRRDEHEVRRLAHDYFPELMEDDFCIEPVVGPFVKVTPIPDPIGFVEVLRIHGITAQPNYVYFSHGAGPCPVYPGPVYPGPVYPGPVYPGPVYPGPVYPGPVYPGPVYPGAVYPGAEYAPPFVPGPFDQVPVAAPRHVASSCLAIPPKTHTKHLFDRIFTPPDANSPDVIVLDTGLAKPPYLPLALQSGSVLPWTVADQDDKPDWAGNGFLAEAAGHGTFIAGVIEQIAPGCTITVHRVLSSHFATTDEIHVTKRLNAIDGTLADPKRTVINMSFGGQVLDHPHLMAYAVRALQHQGVTFVASAGNDATWRKQYPAAMPNVIAVGGVGPMGPAWFTNYGPWVDACAPGVGILSTFFTDWNGATPMQPNGLDPDDYQGWAYWSGTSFSAPVVVGNLARLMMAGATAPEAIDRLINAQALTRLPYLGTVVDAM